MTGSGIRIDEEYYLLASVLAPRRGRWVLNHGASFAIVDTAGDIPLAGMEAYGFFHRGTRFLSRLELQLNGGLPLLLSTVQSPEGSDLVSYLSNADESRAGEVVLERDTVSIQRSKTVLDGVLYERLQLHNYGADSLNIVLDLLFGSDFADIFELRGMERKTRGEVLEPDVTAGTVQLAYRGLDHVRREMRMLLSPVPHVLTPETASFQLDLPPRDDITIELRAECHIGAAQPHRGTFVSALSTVRRERAEWSDQLPALSSDNDGFNDWLNRSANDLVILRTVGSHGAYIHAGIPWFATLFGRDALLTALETLMIAPDLAAGTLRTLAALQGRESNPRREEEPGKILHEQRQGEMADLGEIPFGRYYGSVDATPLFLVLLAEYARRTADLELVRELWPAALAAMEWIDRFDNGDGHGYVQYERRTPQGLTNQGWKDSRDSISHADGRLAELPIALAEVQAYVYAARRGLAQLARRLECAVEAATWEAKASLLWEQFNKDFWLPEQETFAIALDRQQRPCRLVSSNAGHCLFGGIAEPDRAARVVARLMRDDVFSGWGIRTLSAEERRYNPMSYHNGSVWPHDNALIAAGFARYGARDKAAQLLTGMFEASSCTGNWQLPELFCGFPRRRGEDFVPYPVACRPQAWAAGAVFLLLQATLGLTIDAWERRITFDRTALPVWLNRLDISGLKVCDARVDLSVVRGRWGAAVEVIDKRGDLEIEVRK